MAWKRFGQYLAFLIIATVKDAAVRRYLCVGVLAVVLVGTVDTPTVAQETPSEDGGGFVDIEGNPHEEDIRFIVKRGLTVGCDLDGPRYCPDSPVTRAQMAAFLVRALRLDTTVPYLGVYSDVEEGAWYTRFVEAMGAHGLTDTQVSGSYRPNDPMLRSEMAIFLQKAFRLPLSDEASASSFQDIPVAATYAGAAEAVLEAGITRGCGVDPIRYCPDDTVKRDTMAAFLARALRASDLQEVLDLAPGRDALKTISIGEDTWKVWVCDNAAIREDLVVYLNREISSYYRWLSGNKHRIRFEYGTDPSPEVTTVLDDCDNKDHLNGFPAGANVFAGGDLWTVAYGYVGLGGGAFNPESQTFSRNLWMDRRALYDTTAYAHEIGHTFGWPHNHRDRNSPPSEPLHTRMDIMASLGQVIGTNAHNLFQLGWIDPEKVALHSAESATYTITPPHSGGDLELLMLPLGPDRLISIGARVKEGLDKNILKEGVELYEIALCEGTPGCKHVYLPPGTRSNNPVVLDVGESWTGWIPTVDQEKTTGVEYKVIVQSRQHRTFTVRVEKTSDVEETSIVEETPIVVGFSSLAVGGAGVCSLPPSGPVHCLDYWAGHPPPQGVLTSISIGYFACGIRLDGSMECWGYDDHGSMVEAPEGEFAGVSVTGHNACGVRSNGTVECWGSDHHGSVLQALEEDYISVSTGWSHACGIRTDKAVDCWANTTYASALVSPEGHFISVSAGGHFACGLRPDSSVVCWGNDQDARSQPPPYDFIAVDAGWNHACGIRVNGAVACWGNNDSGEASPPQGIFTTITAGDDRTCGLRLDHTVECWGRTP